MREGKISNGRDMRLRNAPHSHAFNATLLRAFGGWLTNLQFDKIALVIFEITEQGTEN